MARIIILVQLCERIQTLLIKYLSPRSIHILRKSVGTLLTREDELTQIISRLDRIISLFAYLLSFYACRSIFVK